VPHHLLGLDQGIGGCPLGTQGNLRTIAEKPGNLNTQLRIWTRIRPHPRRGVSRRCPKLVRRRKHGAVVHRDGSGESKAGIGHPMEEVVCSYAPGVRGGVWTHGSEYRGDPSPTARSLGELDSGHRRHWLQEPYGQTPHKKTRDSGHTTMIAQGTSSSTNSLRTFVTWEYPLPAQVRSARRVAMGSLPPSRGRSPSTPCGWPRSTLLVTAFDVNRTHGPSVLSMSGEDRGGSADGPRRPKIGPCSPRPVPYGHPGFPIQPGCAGGLSTAAGPSRTHWVLGPTPGRAGGALPAGIGRGPSGLVDTLA
jgi:hypothetical protein